MLPGVLLPILNLINEASKKVEQFVEFIFISVKRFFANIMINNKVFDREDLKSYEVIQINSEEEFLKIHKKCNISDSYKTHGSHATMEQQEKDLISMWEWFYHHKKWGHITPFNDKGGIGDAYILFKHKY